MWGIGRGTGSGEDWQGRQTTGGMGDWWVTASGREDYRGQLEVRRSGGRQANGGGASRQLAVWVTGRGQPVAGRTIGDDWQ